MSRLAASLLGIAGVVHATLAAGAITGAERLEANVREIAGSPVGGDLYFSLSTWGVIFAVIAALELYGAWRLFDPARHARLIGLVAAFVGLGASFFSLSLFRWPVVATIPVLLAATYVLSYRVAAPAEESFAPPAPRK